MKLFKRRAAPALISRSCTARTMFHASEIRVISHTFKRLTAVIVMAALLFCNSYAFSLKGINTEDGEVMADFFRRLMLHTEEQYRFDVTYEELLESALMKVLEEHPEMFAEFAKGAYEILDENSSYLTEEEYGPRVDNVTGQFVGIGVNISFHNGKAVIGTPLEGSTAPAAGIKVGDVVKAVDGVDVTGFDLDNVVSLIRGEENTFVTLLLDRDGTDVTVSAKRVPIKVTPVEYKKLDKNNAGYVKITTFNANTNEYLTKALDDLASQGVDKIILDLRDNLGGFLEEAVATASHFVPDKALIVTESYKDESRDVSYYANPVERKFKVVVLVNEYSASASELVAGAIRDHKAGLLVGTDTYGKGTVQTSNRLKNNDAIWLTVAKYNLPSGENIHETGIKPEYYVENEFKYVDKSIYSPLEITRRIGLNDSGEDVKALKQRLKALGYYITDDNNMFDNNMFDVICDFQKINGLFSYGVADFTTQELIESQARYVKVVEDHQYNKSLELIYSMK